MSRPALPFIEFIVLVALMFSMIAFAIDSMLPAFPEIARDLDLGDMNRAQLVITTFFLGTGFGQLLSGPLSDSVGRKPVILGGLVLFVAACIGAWYSQSLEMLLVMRFVQGLGVSAPRTVTLALVRDLYSGRVMAQVMSLSMVLFVLVPAVAPLVGQTIMQAWGWRSIFLAFIVFAFVGALWLGLRQPETLAPGHRRPLRRITYVAAMREVAASRIVMTYTAVLACGFGSIFAYLSSAQQIYVGVFGVGDDFPYYFAVIALVSGTSGFLNASLVTRFGMRLLASSAFGLMVVVTVLFTAVAAFGGLSTGALFRVFLVWSAISFFIPGLTFGNLNSLAMEPMGHIAGMAAAIMGALSTLLGFVIAVPIGLAFDGTLMPMLIGMSLCNAAAFALMLSDPKRRQA